jgi:hypothetical protein
MGFLLRGGERRLSIAPLNLDDREQLVIARSTRLQLIVRRIARSASSRRLSPER